MKILVILNEQHKLLPDQERLLNEDFEHVGWEIFPVPAEGWTLEQIKEEVLPDLFNRAVVFASPVPALLLFLASQRGGERVWLFHNDRRVAKEIPDGKGGKKLIHVVATDGWQLV